MDRTFFQAMTAQEADDYQRNYLSYPAEERLRIAMYLTAIAYNFDINNPPKMDRNVFSKEKL